MFVFNVTALNTDKTTHALGYVGLLNMVYYTCKGGIANVAHNSVKRRLPKYSAEI